jgi:hypothetical protein
MPDIRSQFRQISHASLSCADFYGRQEWFTLTLETTGQTVISGPIESKTANWNQGNEVPQAGCCSRYFVVTLLLDDCCYQDSAADAARPASLPQKVQSPTALPLT